MEDPISLLFITWGVAGIVVFSMFFVFLIVYLIVNLILWIRKKIEWTRWESRDTVIGNLKTITGRRYTFLIFDDDQQETFYVDRKIIGFEKLEIGKTSVFTVEGKFREIKFMGLSFKFFRKITDVDF
jgi:hypothetical protein